MSKTAPLLITLLSGASCLVYELVWSRYLTLIFGVSAHGVAAVLACFMAGLAFGAWHLGKRLDDRAVDGRAVAKLHLALAAILALSPWIYEALDAATRAALLALEPEGMAKPLLRLVFALPTLLAPTYLMGGVFPALVKATRARRQTSAHGRGVDDVARDIGAFYAVNTLGGVAGAFLTGFVLIRSFGLAGTLLIAAGLQAAAAAIAWRALRPAPATIPSPPPEKRRRAPAASSVAGRASEEEAVSPAARRVVLLALGVSGFTALAYQVYWTRLLTFFFRDSLYDFSIVLTTFLAGLFGGGLLGARLAGRLGARAAVFALAAVQIVIAFSALAGLFLVGRLPFLINDLQTNTALVARFGENFWAAGVGIRFAYAAALMLAPTLLFGATFPLASRVLCSGDETVLGRRLGALSGINSLGAALGPLAAGFGFIALLGLQRGVMAAAALNLAAGCALLAASPTGSRPRRAMLGLGSAGLAAWLVVAAPGWDALRMSTSFLDQRQDLEQLLDLKFYKEDASGVTSVVELVPLRRTYLVSNRLYAHNTSELGGLEDHRRLGHLPMLLHPKPERALVVGLGAGLTLRGVAEHDVDVDCVELSPGVVEAARLFGVENDRVMENPRVRFIVDDGRSHVTATRARYDVIVMDILFPMSAGSSTVFSREYYDACRERLNPGGLVCQWLPVHQLSLEEIRIITATFQDVFPNTSVWHGLIGEAVAVVGLVGTEKPLAIDRSVFARNHERAAFNQALDGINLGRPELVLSHFIMAGEAVSDFHRGAPLNTDDRPRVEFLAPKLAVQSRVQGVGNLRAFSERTGDVGPYLRAPAAKGGDATADARIARDVAAKRAVIDGFSLGVAGAPEAQARVHADALARDPANEDLRWVLGGGR